MSTDPAGRHLARMQRKKALIDQRIAEAREERGLLLVHTGSGKGKSTAAFGLLARTLGHGLKAGVVQFIKAPAQTGEEAFFRRFPDDVYFYAMGEGFTWETQNLEQDRAAAARAWARALALLARDDLALVVLDELNIALKHGLLPLADVLAGLRARAARQHVVITGRGAPAALIGMADTVTDMRLVSHAFQAGVRAQPGIEF